MSDYEPGDTMVEALRRANPLTLDPTVSRRSLPSAHALFADVVAQRPRRVRTRVLVVAIAIVLIALMLMAFVLARRETAAMVTTPACYSADSLTAPRLIASGDTPVDACAQVWKRGVFGSRAVPDFDVCVLPSGVAAVFPGESGSVCAGLGLPEASGDDPIEQFTYDVDGRISGECLGLDQTTQIVNAELKQRGLASWRVTSAGVFDPPRTCATIGANPATRTVHIIAIRDPLPPVTTAAP